MLTPRVFTATTFDRKPYDIDFVPTIIDGSEYYEVKSKDFHYGYMTEALVNKIFETRPGSKDRYVDSFSFETKVKDNQQYLKLKNRIILDLPSNIDEANAFRAFSFYGVKYADDVKKEPIFIRSKSGFSLSGVSSEMEFIFPNNELNCGGFYINDLNKGLTTIEIDAPNGNIQSVNIDSFSSPGNEKNDAHLSVTFEKEWGNLIINNFYIPTYPGESGYLRIKTGDQLSLVNGGINSDNQKDLDLLLLESSKSIVIHDSHLFFSQTEKYLKDRPFVGISGDGSIHLLYNDCYINGLVQNDQSLEVVAPNPKETYKRYSFFITNSTFKSPVVLSLTKDANSLLVSDTLIDNKGKETALKGDIRILGSELTGDGKKKQAITNSSIRWSKLINFGTIKYSTISNTLLENCKITNKSQGSESLIFGKKIILDVSSTKDINDFEKIILSPVTYTKGAKPLTIKIGTFFCIQNQGKLLDINVKSDFIECDNFLVSNLTSTTLNIDLNNKSPYFGGVHLYGVENVQNPGGEINLHIKANSKNGYSSINIHQLSIDSEKKGDKSPLHIGFEFGDGVLNASGARINIQSSEKSTKKDYYVVGSATNGVDLGNSEIIFLDGGSDKCSYLKAKGLLHAYSSKLHIGGTNIVNGDLTYSGNERKKALLILRNLISYSNLNIKSSTDGVFNFIDTTISNGKKIIIIEERCNLINTSIENEGKKDLELTAPRIRHSKLKNVSSLKYVDMFFASSKTCLNCLNKNSDLKLKDRIFVCPSCGFTIDRDTAAGINLREEMERYLIGIAHPEFTLVERSSVDDRSLGYLRSTFSMKQEDSINLLSNRI